MSTPGGSLPSFEISRRNLMRAGAIVASALIAKATTALADDFDRDRGRSSDRDWWHDKDRTEIETTITTRNIAIVF